MSLETILYNTCREIIKLASEQFSVFVTFDTTHPEDVLPDFLKVRYPEEITIVLHHQFTNLETTETKFDVDLSFAGLPAHVSVPFAAIKTIHNPETNCTLVMPQKQIMPQDDKQKEEKPEEKQASIITVDFKNGKMVP